MSINWFRSSTQQLDIWAQAIYCVSLHILKSVRFPKREALIWLQFSAGQGPGCYAQRASEKFISECPCRVAPRHTASMETHTQFSRIYTWERHHDITMVWVQPPNFMLTPVRYTHVQWMHLHAYVHIQMHAHTQSLTLDHEVSQIIYWKYMLQLMSCYIFGR